MKSNSKHWDAIYSEKEDSKLGWYEKDLFPILKLLKHIPNQLIEYFDHVFINPNGDPRPYIYALFQNRVNINES